MAGDVRGGDILVAVEDPEHVAQLVRTASDLARQVQGRVRLMTVVVKSRDSPFGMFTDETIIEEFAADSHELLDEAPDPKDVEIVRDLVVGRSVSRGIVSAVKRTDPAALVIGWDDDPRRTDVLLGTTVDEVFERAPTDVYAERIGREAGKMERVLVAVGGGPHVGAAVRAGGAIATANDADVTVLSVGADETGVGTAQVFAQEGAEMLRDVVGGRIPVETRIETAKSVEDAIIEAADDHDLVLLGATRKGVFRGRLVGSVPRRVVRGTDRTVIIARSKSGQAGRIGRLVSKLTGTRL